MLVFDVHNAQRAIFGKWQSQKGAQQKLNECLFLLLYPHFWTNFSSSLYLKHVNLDHLI